MHTCFISNIKINKVRHLKDLKIELSAKEKKHLIITGKNGSGKTSLLNSMAIFLNSITNTDVFIKENRNLVRKDGSSSSHNDNRNRHYDYVVTDGNLSLIIENEDIDRRRELSDRLACSFELHSGGVTLDMNCSLKDVHREFIQGQFVVAYYQADRVFEAQVPKHVEKVVLKDEYAIEEKPREDFIKYLLDLKMTQALATANGKKDKAENIKLWFEKFQDLLKTIFDDDSVKLDFDEDTFMFQILMDGREPFDFNELSSGYAAILDIVVDLIIRMEKQTEKVFDFSIPGIVLIDEIETHLHLAMQKKILTLLTTIFPNVQFIVSTHSPFIVNSLENAVIYDLEKQLLVKDGLSDVPYAGIVEGYFNSDLMSSILREKYERYKKLAQKKELNDDDLEEISDLEMYLEEIPDYLALNITTEYQRLKAELRNREDI